MLSATPRSLLAAAVVDSVRRSLLGLLGTRFTPGVSPVPALRATESDR